MILDSPTTESASPFLLPRYETIAPIGRGGMAEVFLAVMVGAGGIPKLAVLKRIWPELASDPHFLAMFLDEARLSVRMAHPNLVQTYGVVEEHDGLAIAMEYLDGQPLGRTLNRLFGAGGLSLPQRVRIVTKLLAGLDYAHELTDYDGTPLSVVHRDVSPHNVFITYDGSVKLVDFGVAKSVASAHHTRPGTIKGKFSYMAPEQFQGHAADRRSDIFAVGVILWEMLAARRMWNGVPDNQIAGHLLSGRSLPSLPEELGLPVEFEEICARALNPDPDQRYATAAQMEADLEQVLTSNHEVSDRMLGKAVAEGFAAERAERQTLIDQQLRRIRTGSYPSIGGAYPTPSAPLAAVVIPTAATPTRFPWVAISLTTALSIAVLATFLSGRAGTDRSRAPMFESPLPSAGVNSAGVNQPEPSASPAPVPRAAADLAHHNRRSTPGPHRDAAPTMAATAAAPAMPPASRADRGADQKRAVPQSHPQPHLIDKTSPFEKSGPLDERRSPPLPIDVANPFRQGVLPKPLPIDSRNPFSAGGSRQAE